MVYGEIGAGEGGWNEEEWPEAQESEPNGVKGAVFDECFRRLEGDEGERIESGDEGKIRKFEGRKRRCINIMIPEETLDAEQRENDGK